MKSLFKLRVTVNVIMLTVVSLVLVIYLSLQEASHQGNWTKVTQRMALPTLHGNSLVIKDVRNFLYESDNIPRLERYSDNTYALDQVKTLWFGLSHFGDPGLAHAFVSFEFTTGEFLTVSIEARLEQGDSYHPIKGLFRQYETIYIFGSESDIIGLRSHIRQEPVYLYQLSLAPDAVQEILRRFVQDAQDIYEQPQFYNTVLSNCLSRLLLVSGYFTLFDVLTDWRILLPGFSDQVAYELGLIDNSKTLDQLKAAAKINPAITPEDPSFSRAIRL